MPRPTPSLPAALRTSAVGAVFAVVAALPLLLPDAGASVVERASAADATTRTTSETPAERVQRQAAQQARLAAEQERLAAEQARLAAEQAERERASRAARERDPRAVARALLAELGQADQFSCLEQLWVRESNWDHTATNPSSGAYGIPQALPASKLATAGADWRTNPATQVRWGVDYITDSYGSPCAAWRFWQNNNWY